MAGTSYTCCVEDNCQGEINNSDFSHSQTDNSGCFPFSACAASYCSVEITSSFKLSAPLSIAFSYYDIEINFIPFRNSLPLLQPPKLSVSI